METITTAGEILIAQKKAAGLPLVVDTFVLALVADQDETVAIDRTRGLPQAEEVVYQAPVTQSAYIDSASVVYSLFMGSDVGPFSFNTIYLVCSEDNDTVLAMATLPEVNKIANDLTQGVRGTSMTRNVVIAFDGAQALTAINVEAAAWQFDLTDATELNKGLIKLATQEEVDAGDENHKAVTSKKLLACWRKQMVSSGGTVLEAGDFGLGGKAQTLTDYHAVIKSGMYHSLQGINGDPETELYDANNLVIQSQESGLDSAGILKIRSTASDNLSAWIGSKSGDNLHFDRLVTDKSRRLPYINLHKNAYGWNRDSNGDLIFPVSTYGAASLAEVVEAASLPAAVMASLPIGTMLDKVNAIRIVFHNEINGTGSKDWFYWCPFNFSAGYFSGGFLHVYVVEGEVAGFKAGESGSYLQYRDRMQGWNIDFTMHYQPYSEVYLFCPFVVAGLCPDVWQVQFVNDEGTQLWGVG